ncbi:hypothetical protein AQ907_12690 [Burkholderia pseudomallei]|nr:hypothetical protein AQ907_12690 [Burkholderia pseudomallei]
MAHLRLISVDRIAAGRRDLFRIGRIRSSEQCGISAPPFLLIRPRPSPAVIARTSLSRIGEEAGTALSLPGAAY